jgi:amino acid transporter
VHKTPAVATLLFAGLALIVLWVYVLGSSSVQGAFTNVISSVGLMFALFYAATGVGMAVYYRKLALRSPRGFLELMLVPGVSAIFLLWVAVKLAGGLDVTRRHVTTGRSGGASRTPRTCPGPGAGRADRTGAGQ